MLFISQTVWNNNWIISREAAYEFCLFLSFLSRYSDLRVVRHGAVCADKRTFHVWIWNGRVTISCGGVGVSRRVRFRRKSTSAGWRASPYFIRSEKWLWDIQSDNIQQVWKWNGRNTSCSERWEKREDALLALWDCSSLPRWCRTARAFQTLTLMIVHLLQVFFSSWAGELFIHNNFNNLVTSCCFYLFSRTTWSIPDRDNTDARPGAGLLDVLRHDGRSSA